jgi:hypothetical protein
MTESKRASFLGALPEALFVALLTGGAYWLAFVYEAGYLSSFDLPPHLVEVSLQTTLIVALALSGAIWVVFSVINIFLMSWPKHPAIQQKVFRIMLMLLFPIWHLLNYGFRTQDWVYYGIFLVFIVILELVWPLLVFRKKGSLRERFIADEIAEASPQERTIFGRIFDAFGPGAYGLLLLFVIGSLLAHTAGRAKAETQKEYFVFADAPDVAVVRIYHDTIIAVPFDRRTRTIQSQVIVWKIGTEKVALTLDKDVGPLKKQKPMKLEGSKN